MRRPWHRVQGRGSGWLGIENELTQEDVDPADLVLESVDVGVENEDRFEQKMAEGKFLRSAPLM